MFLVVASAWAGWDLIGNGFILLRQPQRPARWKGGLVVNDECALAGVGASGADWFPEVSNSKAPNRRLSSDLLTRGAIIVDKGLVGGLGHMR